VIGAVNDLSGARDVVVCAAGSMPGDLHKMWRTSDAKGYQVEYGYSCMGYEIAGGLGAKMAAPDREVIVMVGDGSYLMMAQELVTAVQEGVKLVVVIVQNHCFASISGLSETVGVPQFGTRYRYRGQSGRLDGDILPIDLAANAAGLGAQVLRADTPGSFSGACARPWGRPGRRWFMWSASWRPVPHRAGRRGTFRLPRCRGGRSPKRRGRHMQAKTSQRGHLRPFAQLRPVPDPIRGPGGGLR